MITMVTTTMCTTEMDTTAMDTTAMDTTAMDKTMMDTRGMNAIISAREEPNVAKILDSNSVQIQCTVVNLHYILKKLNRFKNRSPNLDKICAFLLVLLYLC